MRGHRHRSVEESHHVQHSTYSVRSVPPAAPRPGAARVSESARRSIGLAARAASRVEPLESRVLFSADAIRDAGRVLHQQPWARPTTGRCMAALDFSALDFYGGSYSSRLRQQQRQRHVRRGLTSYTHDAAGHAGVEDARPVLRRRGQPLGRHAGHLRQRHDRRAPGVRRELLRRQLLPVGARRTSTTTRSSSC